MSFPPQSSSLINFSSHAWKTTWVQRHADVEPWLKDHVNFSECFLMGNSSGANTSSTKQSFALPIDLNLSPIAIRGLIFQQPYFGGVHRTETDVKLANDRVFPLVANDFLWDLSLPEGADRDHEYCNPFVNGRDGRIGRLPRSLVCGFDGDPLMVDRRKAEALYKTVKKFMY